MREAISGIVTVVLAVALACACAISNGAIAPLFAAVAGLLPALWVIGSDGRPQVRVEAPAKRLAPRRLGSVDDRGRSPLPAFLILPGRDVGWLPMQPPPPPTPPALRHVDSAMH